MPSNLSQQYHELIQWLFVKHNAFGGKDLRLERMQEACKQLGHPERSFPCVHVAGTNGKGSVCAKIAKAFELANYKVGLFTSPHISSFTERVQINSILITFEEVLVELTKIKHFDLSFFELTTLLAFRWFEKQKVDIAVLETGVGGRLDSTNVCNPDLCVITSIGIDHTNYLGSTLEEIAKEKAGIIKKNVPVVVGPKVPLEVICQQADLQQSRVIRVEGDWINFDEENSAIADQALQVLTPSWPSLGPVIKDALLVSPPCRFQQVEKSSVLSRFGKAPPDIVLDVAHNPDAMKRLMMRVGQQQCVVLLAVSQGKNIDEMICSLLDKACAIVCTQAPCDRAFLAS